MPSVKGRLHILVFLWRVVSIDKCKNIKGRALHAKETHSVQTWALIIWISLSLLHLGSLLEPLTSFMKSERNQRACWGACLTTVPKVVSTTARDGDDTSLVLPCEFSLTFLIVNNCHGTRNALLFRETIILLHTVLTSYLDQLTM